MLGIGREHIEPFIGRGQLLILCSVDEAKGKGSGELETVSGSPDPFILIFIRCRGEQHLYNGSRKQ